MKSGIKNCTRYLFVLGWLLVANSMFAQSVEPADSVESNLSQDKKHMPNKATMYSAVLPGLGQVYNKQWWKVPFVYGGFAGLGYFVHVNNTGLNRAKQFYFDITDSDPNTKSYADYYPKVDFNNSSTANNYKDTFRRAIDSYRRQRDLLVFGTVGFYLFNILDANVGGHLIDFDISEDLSINFEPIATDPLTFTPIFGARLVYTF